jgi:16S rRNA (guanine966-N2)-methyltransferase
MLRIIAGQAKGMPLEVPSGGGTRPMDSRARGALFNILQTEVPGAAVLDLYAGSGSLGLEALSRGATGCVFVDRDRGSVRALDANLARTKLDGGEVLAYPAGAALKFLRGDAHRFDLIFFDPPFREERAEPERARVIAELASAAELLAPGGCLIWRLEQRNFHPEELPPALEVADRREYGRSLLVFLRPRESPAPAEREPQSAEGQP